MFNIYNFLTANFTAKNNYKQELNGIFIEPNRTTATDGFSLLSVSKSPDTEEEYPQTIKKHFKPFILPKEEANALQGYIKQKSTAWIDKNIAVFERQEDSPKVKMGNPFQNLTFEAIETEYPEFQQLLKEDGKFVKICLNPEYVKKMADFFNKFLDEGKGMIIKVPLGERMPIRFYGKRKDGQESQGIIMPILMEEEE